MPYLVRSIHRKSTRLGGMEKLMLSAVAMPFVALRPFAGTFTRFTCDRRLWLRVPAFSLDKVKEQDARGLLAQSTAAHLEELDEGKNS